MTKEPPVDHRYRLVIACPDRVGIVARVSQFIADHGGSLSEASYHADPDSQRFFMRTEITAESLNVSLASFRERFAEVAEQFSMQWFVRDSIERRRVILLASKASHCLSDLLHRWRSGDLHCDIPCVISNHEALRELVEWHGIPYRYVPFPDVNALQGAELNRARQAANEILQDTVREHSPDTIVLARYMQIIPPAMCREHQHKIINIHHSFLPSFVGADPYQRAYDRGVKLIGATCHYVTDELDEGPIIEQDVVRVGHQYDKSAMVRLGKDVETAVLAKGLRYHLEDRCMVYGNKTVIFE